jgi:hypothetical protein
MTRIKLLLIAAVIVLGGVAHADDIRYYDIEIVVFENLDPSARVSENWPHEVILETPPLVVDLGQPFPGALPKGFDPKHTFKVTASNQLQLLEEAKLLADSRNYRVLLHTGWRQPGMDVDAALPVHINQTFVVDEAGNPLANAPVVGAPVVQTTQTRSTLSGYIKVILSRYLHMDVKLAYTTKIPLATETVMTAAQLGSEDATPLSPPKPIVYFLDETRKMRSKEVHYLDNPVLGVLLLATPYEGSSAGSN